MDYFELLVDPSISNPIQIQHVDRSVYKNETTYEEFDAAPKMTVGYFDNSPQIEIYDLLGQPALLLSDNLKRLFALYVPEMQVSDKLRRTWPTVVKWEKEGRSGGRS